MLSRTRLKVGDIRELICAQALKYDRVNRLSLDLGLREDIYYAYKRSDSSL